jgi:hypothetical protein
MEQEKKDPKSENKNSNIIPQNVLLHQISLAQDVLNKLYLKNNNPSIEEINEISKQTGLSKETVKIIIKKKIQPYFEMRKGFSLKNQFNSFNNVHPKINQIILPKANNLQNPSEKNPQINELKKKTESIEEHKEKTKEIKKETKDETKEEKKVKNIKIPKKKKDEVVEYIKLLNKEDIDKNGTLLELLNKETDFKER